MHETFKVVALVFILQVAVLLSTALLFNTYGGSLAHEIYQQDAAKFIGVADALLTDGYFHAALHTEPDTWLTPGYPLIVAAVFALTNHSLSILLVLLALVGAATSGLIYLIGSDLGLSRQYAITAAILFGISPAVIWIPASGMGGDIVFAFLLSLALYLLLQLARSEKWWLTALLLGLVLGLATLVRPIGLYLSLLAIIAAPFVVGISYLTRRASLIIIIALIAFGLTLSPWMARNEIVAHHFSLTSQFAFNPFYYNIPSFYASKNHTSVESEQNKLMDSVGTRDTYALVNGFTYSDQLSAIDKQFLRENFVSYAVFHASKTLPFFFGSGVNVIYATITNEIPSMPDAPFLPRASQNTSSLFYGGSYRAVINNLIYYWPATLERLLWLALFALAFVAPFVTRGIGRRFAVLGVIFILAVALLASPIAQPRYRIPAEPFVWLGAALTLVALKKKGAEALLCAC